MGINPKHMATATITNASYKESWQTKRGDQMHTLNIELSDGRKGTVNARTPDRWKQGDEVEVEVVEKTDYGHRFRFDKPGYGNSEPNKSREDRTPYIEASWAIQVASQSMAGTAYDMDTLLHRSRRLIEARNELVHELKQQS